MWAPSSSFLGVRKSLNDLQQQCRAIHNGTAKPRVNCSSVPQCDANLHYCPNCTPLCAMYNHSITRVGVPRSLFESVSFQRDSCAICEFEDPTFVYRWIQRYPSRTSVTYPAIEVCASSPTTSTQLHTTHCRQ